MGWDVSYHPVDVQFIHTRVIPFVRGEGSLDDLMDDALRLTKVRHRANAWGLGLLKMHHHVGDSAPRSIHGLPGVNSDIHIWGRPFFIAGASDQVSSAIDRYLAASETQVDDIAREMLAVFDEQMSAEVREIVGGSLVDLVQPAEEDELPADDELANNIRWKMDLFRKAYPALGTRRKIKDEGGDEHVPEELFTYSFPFAALEFAAHFRPGWMARGYGWPTLFLSNVGNDLSALFSKPIQLVEPLLQDIPAIASELTDTIEENFSLGGFVRADQVRTLLAEIDKRTEPLKEWTKSEGWDEDSATIYLQGMREAATDALQRGIAFIEASEVYSGPLGILN